MVKPPPPSHPPAWPARASGPAETGGDDFQRGAPPLRAFSGLLDRGYLSVIAETQLIWNDRCQHLDPTWRRPGGRDEIASTARHSDIRGLLREEPHDRAPSRGIALFFRASRRHWASPRKAAPHLLGAVLAPSFRTSFSCSHLHPLPPLGSFSGLLDRVLLIGRSRNAASSSYHLHQRESVIPSPA